MYPLIRTALTIRAARRMPRLGLCETHVMGLRCWPWDADMFWEMNNGRVLTLCDLGRTGLAVRSGLWAALKENGWGLVVAGASVRYRARIRPFQRVELRTRVLGWDSRFIYIEQAMWRGETCCHHLLLRTGVTVGGRLADTAMVAEALGAPGEAPPLPGWVTEWIAADATRP
ncbi:MAG: acyl-CoA thioesterase [Roseicyclus sp.]